MCTRLNGTKRIPFVRNVGALSDRPCSVGRRPFFSTTPAIKARFMNLDCVVTWGSRLRPVPQGLPDEPIDLDKLDRNWDGCENMINHSVNGKNCLL